jgi:hypothetical protein
MSAKKVSELLMSEVDLKKRIEELQDQIAHHNQKIIPSSSTYRLDVQSHNEIGRTLHELLEEIHPDSRKEFAENKLSASIKLLDLATEKQKAIITRNQGGDVDSMDGLRLFLLDEEIKKHNKLISKYEQHLELIEEMEANHQGLNMA